MPHCYGRVLRPQPWQTIDPLSPNVPFLRHWTLSPSKTQGTKGQKVFLYSLGCKLERLAHQRAKGYSKYDFISSGRWVKWYKHVPSRKYTKLLLLFLERERRKMLGLKSDILLFRSNSVTLEGDKFLLLGKFLYIPDFSFFHRSIMVLY